MVFRYTAELCILTINFPLYGGYIYYINCILILGSILDEGLFNQRGSVVIAGYATA